MHIRMAVFVCMASITSSAVAEDDFPYKAFVSGKNVYVRSGPGKDYYATEKLQKGDEVEVWRHDPGGWYAVRPPRGSFSWVKVKHLRPTNQEGIYAVAEQGTIVRVGSELKKMKDVIQIRLDKDELVEVLEEDTDLHGKTWCRIAPPAGEFRWVFGRYINTKGDRVARGPDTRQNLVLQKLSQRSTEPQSETRRSPSKRGVDSSVDGDGTPAKPASFDRADDPKRGQRERLERAPLGWKPRLQPVEPRRLDPVPVADEEPGAKPVLKEKTESVAPRRRASHSDLPNLELELGKIVARKADAWDFVDLKAKVVAAHDSAKSSVHRGLARRLLSRIERYEMINDRLRAVRAIQADTDRKERGLEEKSRMPKVISATYEEAVDDVPAESGDRPAKAVDKSPYDAEGELISSAQNNVDTPPFVLVDKQRDENVYVTPSPGFNLRRFVGKRIGVYGIRGYNVKTKTHQVVVKQAVVLGDGKKK